MIRYATSLRCFVISSTKWTVTSLRFFRVYCSALHMLSPLLFNAANLRFYSFASARLRVYAASFFFILASYDVFFFTLAIYYCSNFCKCASPCVVYTLWICCIKCTDNFSSVKLLYGSTIVSCDLLHSSLFSSAHFTLCVTRLSSLTRSIYALIGYVIEIRSISFRIANFFSL